MLRHKCYFVSPDVAKCLFRCVFHVYSMISGLCEIENCLIIIGLKSLSCAAFKGSQLAINEI